MFCSTPIGRHLIRGLGAVALLGLAIFSTADAAGNPLAWLAAAPLVAGAFFLLRGCPMCWLIGLFETVRKRKDAADGVP